MKEVEDVIGENVILFLNTGYKSRSKSSDVIINEIRTYIKAYGVKRFLFLDNDIIGGDHYRFNDLLDGLIKIREDYNDFLYYQLR